MTKKFNLNSSKNARVLVVAIIFAGLSYAVWTASFRMRRRFSSSGNQYALPNGYDIFELTSHNSQVGAPDIARASQKGWCRPTNPIDGVQLLDVENEIVFGIATKPRGELDKAFMGCPGYFWINTRTHESHVGMDLESWLAELKSRFGIEDAKSKLDSVRVLPYLRKNF